MRHLKAGRKLGRTSAHRKAMFRNLVTALIRRERIRTTLAKAKELRSKIEKTITLGKKGTLHARRRALRVVADKESLKKLFGPLAERFAKRNGGYTRIIKIGNRRGDEAPMALIELVEDKPEKAEKTPAKTKKESKATPPAAKKASKKKASPEKSEETKPKKSAKKSDVKETAEEKPTKKSAPKSKETKPPPKKETKEKKK